MAMLIADQPEERSLLCLNWKLKILIWIVLIALSLPVFSIQPTNDSSNIITYLSDEGSQRSAGGLLEEFVVPL